MLRIINRTRARHGLRGLRMWAKLQEAAHAHSRRMATQRRVFHTACLSCVSPDPSWTSMGENVARGRRLRAIHWKFMRSAAHRANILCRCYTRVGVGVVRRGGTLYVTEIFWG